MQIRQSMHIDVEISPQLLRGGGGGGDIREWRKLRCNSFTPLPVLRGYVLGSARVTGLIAACVGNRMAPDAEPDRLTAEQVCLAGAAAVVARLRCRLRIIFLQGSQSCHIPTLHPMPPK